VAPEGSAIIAFPAHGFARCGASGRRWWMPAEGSPVRRTVVVLAVACVLLAGATVVAVRFTTRPSRAPTTPLTVNAWRQPWPPAALATPTAPPIELHAAPGGQGDRCTVAEPCSLTGARDAVRARLPGATQDVVVRLAGGTYALAEPFVLDARDSAPPGRRVVYEAEADAVPVLSGGTRIGGWRRDDPASDVWTADVEPSLDTRQLWVDGARAVRARSIPHPVGWSRTDDGFTAPDIGMADWADPTAIEIVSYREWKSLRCPVARIVGLAVTMAQPCWRNANAHDTLTMTDVTWVENAGELLDEPGEWYLDRTAHRLRYRPRPGEDLRTAEVIAPTLESLVEITGTREQPVRGIELRGLTFAHDTWRSPSTPLGYAVLQAGWHNVGEAVPADETQLARTPGAVIVRYATDVRLEDDVFEHLGSAGLDLQMGSQAVGVVGCTFADISSHGIQIGETGPGSARPDEHNDWLDRIELSNNVVEHVAAEYQDAVGIFVSYASNVSMLHNELRHLPYTGISIGWGWGTDSYAFNNVIQANVVADVMRVLSDGGGIYTLSAQPGSMIVGNDVHDLINPNGALYLDEGSRDFTVAGNVVARAPRWLHIWTSTIRDNVVIDNFADNDRVMNEGTNIEVRNNEENLDAWPAEAQAILDAAGLEGPYRAHRRP